jgi:hypothetical protein
LYILQYIIQLLTFGNLFPVDRTHAIARKK